MAINETFSHGGYNPKNVDIIAEKARLKSLFDERVLNRKEYSNAIRDLKMGAKGIQFTDQPSSLFDNSEIVRSSFSQDSPFTDVFPPSMSGVTFDNCNLDNCKIPQGNTLINTQNRHFEIQNDGEPWEVNPGGVPSNPLNEALFDSLGLSKDPRDIPSVKLDESITATARKALRKQAKKDRIIALASDPVALDAYVSRGKEVF